MQGKRKSCSVAMISGRVMGNIEPAARKPEKALFFAASSGVQGMQESICEPDRAVHRTAYAGKRLGSWRLLHVLVPARNLELGTMTVDQYLDITKDSATREPHRKKTHHRIQYGLWHAYLETAMAFSTGSVYIKYTS
jgi:hypothetical protein